MKIHIFILSLSQQFVLFSKSDSTFSVVKTNFCCGLLETFAIPTLNPVLTPTPWPRFWAETAALARAIHEHVTYGEGEGCRQRALRGSCTDTQRKARR